ncbi:hypothetical protein [Sphingobacterium sp. SGL-16]|uniref:hypothetical protein n=1 Tax=Sphingobacterium sp. SGL-16 TaxID=2710883 RepID=UPI0013ECB1BD|nr:hypothetical protein [Sphingobacterium sp. SGL-16]NGM71643.1 hypothetical protein [Sphingobacterium sp. SGL-16]
MTEIKTLADQLRDTLRTTDNKVHISEKVNSNKISTTKKHKPPNEEHKHIVDFFNALEEFKLEATEKSMIRVDKRTINLLKRLKLAKGIDMNRFIVYALHQYINQHPWLPKHIQEIIKNTDL